MLDDDFLFIVIETVDLLDFHRRRQIIDDGVEDKFNPFVFECWATHDGEECHRECRRSDGVFKHLFGNWFSLEEGQHQLFIEISDRFNQLTAAVFCFLQQVRWNLDLGIVFFRLTIEMISFHSDQVDDAFETVFSADRPLNGLCIFTESFLKGFDWKCEISTCFIHFICKYDSRNLVLIGLPPNRFGLWFHARLSI